VLRTTYILFVSISIYSCFEELECEGELELEFGLMTMTKYNDNDLKREKIQLVKLDALHSSTVIQR
jgi:hypothetical protein